MYNSIQRTWTHPLYCIVAHYYNVRVQNIIFVICLLINYTGFFALVDVHATINVMHIANCIIFFYLFKYKLKMNA